MAGTKSSQIAAQTTTSKDFRGSLRSAKKPVRNIASSKSPGRSSNQDFMSRKSLGPKQPQNQSQMKKYPELNFKTDADFPIKILDNMIQVEEQMANGFSLYNRGQNLKKSLINPERVKEYLGKMEKENSDVAAQQNKNEM